MGRYRETIDLYFTSEGDFFLDSERGDIEDTKLHLYRGFLQRLITRIGSSRGDWIMQPTVGADINNFAGKPNTRAVAQILKDRIIAEIVTEALVRPADVVVDVLPVSNNQIAIVLVIQPADINRQLFLSFTYDMRDNKLVPRNT